jgi:ATP-dependent Clp protease ATP-binding subunit ClpB
VYLLDGITASGEIPEDTRGRVLAELREHFRPEFLNRVDETVLFKPLTLGELEQIVDLQIDSVRRRLSDRQLELEVTEPAKAYLAREGYDPVYGARPLRRFIQREVETRIGRALIAGNIVDGSTIVVDLEDDELVISWRPAGQEAPVGAAA